jgi:methylmalonyl-CoA epimerase
MFKELDHIAIVVDDTENSLAFYRDRLGLEVLFSEVLDDQPVMLTHLELGACQLQLVEPLIEDHPLKVYLRRHGESIHHICFRVANVLDAMRKLSSCGLPTQDKKPRSGPQGRQAAFIDPANTRGIRFEITDKPTIE